MKKIVLLALLILLIFSSVSIAAKITFINNNPEVTKIGIVEFIENDKKELIDYKVLNLKLNDTAIVIIDLKIGVYGVTQFDPFNDKIVNYKMIYVINKDDKIDVIFEKLDGLF